MLLLVLPARDLGSPDLLLTLTNSHTISEPSFRPCVRFVPLIYHLPPAPTNERSLPHRLNRFDQSKTFSFVAPDWRFTLMEYRFDPSASKPGAAPALTAAAAAQLQVQVPFTLRASLSIT